MELSLDVFLELYFNLRSGENVQEVSNLLEQCYLNSESIQINLQIAEQTDDIVLMQYALYGVCVCIRKLQKKIDDSIILQARAKILEFLTTATEPTVINSIIAVIAELITYWQEWHEFTALIFDQNTPIETVLKLLSQLINSIKSTKVIQNLEFFQNLIQRGLETSEFESISYAIQLLFNLAIPIKNYSNTDEALIESFNNFGEPLLAVLKQIIPQGNLEDFMKVSTPIISGLEKGVSLLPFEETIDFFITLLQTQSFEIEYSLHLNNFISSMICYSDDVYFGETEEENNEKLSVIFQLEIALSMNFFESDDMDPTMNWLYDFDQMYNQIYGRLKPSDVIELTQQGINVLDALETPQSRAALLLMIENAMSAEPWEFNLKRNDIFELLMESFRSEDYIVVRMAMRFIDVHASLFSQKINDNSTDFINFAVNLIHGEDPSSASNMLNSVIGVLVDSDPVFEIIFQTSFQLLQSNNPGLQINAAKSLSDAIHRSKSKIESLFNEIITPTLELIGQVFSEQDSMTSIISPLFGVISSLAFRCPDQIVSYFEDIYNILLTAISSDDKYTCIDALNCFTSLVSSIPEAFGDKFSQILDLVRPLFEPHWNIEMAQLNRMKNSKGLEELSLKFDAAICGLKLMISISKVSEDVGLIHESLVFILTILGVPDINGIISGFDSLCRISEIISVIEVPSEIFELFFRMIQQIFNLLNSLKDRNIITSALHVISQIVSLFGPTVLGDYYQMLPPIMLQQIYETFNSNNGYYVYIDSIFDKNVYSVLMIDLLMKLDYSIISNALLPIFDHLLVEQNPDVTSFAIDVCSSVIVANQECFPSEFQQKFMNLLLKYITEGTATLAKSSTNFFCQILKTNSSFVEQIAENVYSLLIQRLQQQNCDDIMTNAVQLEEFLSNCILLFSSAFNFNFYDHVEIVLRSLPYQNEVELNNSAFSFICSVSSSLDINFVPYFVRPLISLFARTVNQLKNLEIEDQILRSCLETLNSLLQNFPDRDSCISNYSIKITINCRNQITSLCTKYS